MSAKAMTQLRLTDIVQTDFRTSASADALNGELLKVLGLPYRYIPARLAIALSLADGRAPAAPSDMRGRMIKGENLFGLTEGGAATWATLVIEHAGGAVLDRRQFQGLIVAHWHRGAERLWKAWQRSGSDKASFLQGLLEKGASRALRGERNGRVA